MPSRARSVSFTIRTDGVQSRSDQSPPPDSSLDPGWRLKQRSLRGIRRRIMLSLLIISVTALTCACLSKTSAAPATPATPQALQAATFDLQGCYPAPGTYLTVDNRTYTIATCGITAAAATYNFTATPSSSWITAFPPFGSIGPRTRASVSVTIRPGGLPAGTHRGSVTFTAPGYRDHRMEFTTYILGAL